MELAYFFSALGFGFICWCIGVRMGASFAVNRIVKEFER
jgi:hypothetical protein